MLVGGVYPDRLGGSGISGPPPGLSMRSPSCAPASGGIVYVPCYNLCRTLRFGPLWEVGPESWPLVSRLFRPTVLAVPVLCSSLPLRPALTRLPEARLWWRDKSLWRLVATVVAAFQPLAVLRPRARRARGQVSRQRRSEGAIASLGRTPTGTRLRRSPNRLLKRRQPKWPGPTERATFNDPRLRSDAAACRRKLYGCTQTHCDFSRSTRTPERTLALRSNAQGNFRPAVPRRRFSRSSALSLRRPRSPFGVRRILSTTVDARLVALDSETGVSF